MPQGVAIRCRSAAQLKGGHQYEVGWFVGKTVREAALNHSWCDGILIGIDDSAINQFDEKDDNDGYNAPGAAGIMGDPDRVINIDDTVIFVSETSSPNVRPNCRCCLLGGGCLRSRILTVHCYDLMLWGRFPKSPWTRSPFSFRRALS